MPSWPLLLDEFNRQPSAEATTAWTESQLNGFLSRIAQRRDTNVVAYASGYLQKPLVPTVVTSIAREDVIAPFAEARGRLTDEDILRDIS